MWQWMGAETEKKKKKGVFHKSDTLNSILMECQPKGFFWLEVHIPRFCIWILSVSNKAKKISHIRKLSNLPCSHWGEYHQL